MESVTEPLPITCETIQETPLVQVGNTYLVLDRSQIERLVSALSAWLQEDDGFAGEIR